MFIPEAISPQTKPRLVVQASACEAHRIAPVLDGDTEVGLGMAIADVKAHLPRWRTVQFPSDPVYYPRFSPDGRYLLGITNWYDLVLVECATTKATKLMNGCAATGWYPDSRTIWCRVFGKGKTVVWYGMDIRTHQRWRLSPAQVRHVQEGWNILNPWWYEVPLDPPKFCVYSRNGRWRLRAEPYDPQLAIPTLASPPNWDISNT